MDTIVISDEEIPVEEGKPYKSLYSRAVEALEETLDPAWGPLATRWFAYDRLALVRTQGFVDVGGWDTLIPFYMTDCDMHERLWMQGLKIEDASAGKVWDVADTLDDLGELYKRGGTDEPSANDEGERRKEKRRGWDDDGEAGEAARKSQVAEAWAEATEQATDTTTRAPVFASEARSVTGEEKTSRSAERFTAEGVAFPSSSPSTASTISIATSKASPTPSSAPSPTDASSSSSASAAAASPSSTAAETTTEPRPSSRPWKPEELNSAHYQLLLSKLDVLQRAKNENPSGRNTWQARQRGGKGEPFYRDPDGFEHGVWMWMDFGRKVFEEKWGRGPCDIRDAGLGKDDAWRVVPEWENPEVRRKYAKEKAMEERDARREQERQKESEAKEGR